MANELKLTNTLLMQQKIIQDGDTTPIFDGKAVGEDARIEKILVVNNESADATLTLKAYLISDKIVIGTFLIPADAGADDEVPAVDIVELCKLSQVDNAGNYYLNVPGDYILDAEIDAVGDINVSITVSGAYYD